MVSDIKALGKKRTYDKRKVALIAIALLIVIMFLLLGSTNIDTDKIKKTGQSFKKEVGGTSTKSINPVSDIKNALEDQIETIQKEAKNINIAEVASSSPQIQKIIKDLKSLENVPADQAKNLCEKICSGL